jgi:AsmA protein
MAEQRTGRELSINDDIELSLFPWFAIETGGITIGNAEGFGGQPFATIDELSARVRVWPLLKRQVEIGTVTIDGVVLNLGRDAEGRTNWDDLLARDEAEPAAEPAAADGGRQIERLAIEGIRIRQGRILWREGDEDVSYVVSDLSLQTGSISNTDPVDVEIGFSILDVASQNRADIGLIATAALVPTPALSDIAVTLNVFDSRQQERADGRLELASARLSETGPIELTAASIAGTLSQAPLGPANVDYTIAWRTAAYDPSAERLDVTGMTARLGPLALALELRGQGPTDDYRVTGTATVADAAAADLLDLAGIAPPQGLTANELGRLDAETAFNVSLASGSIALENLRASLLGLSVSGNANLDANGNGRARIAIPPVTPGDGLRAVLAAYLPDNADAAAISRLGLDANLSRDAAGIVRLSDTVLTLGRGTIAGELTLSPGPDGNRLSGRLRSADLEPDLVAALLPSLLPANVGPDEIGALAVDTAFVYEPRTDRLNLDPLSLHAFGLSGEGSLVVAKLSTAPAVTGQAEIAAFPPKAFLTRFGQPVPQTSDPAAFRSARVAASFELDADHGDFRDIVVDLDDSRITGGLRIDNFSDPSYRFTLRADTIDVDRYLPPPAEEAAAGERAAGDIALRTEPLELLRLEGTASVGDLKLAGLAFQQVTTALDFGDGLARLDSARANLYGGRFEGALAVDTSGATPSMSLKGRAENIALEAFLTALLGEASLSGTGNFDLDLTGMGRTVTENLQTAAGTMGFALTNGAVAGFNLERTLCSVFNRQAGLPAPAAAPERTAYNFIRAAADVSEGIATSRELTAESPALRITGSGRLTLADQRVDYDMRATLTKSIAIAQCESMDRNVGGSFPFTIRGPLSGPPEVLPDFGQYLRDRVRDEFQDRVREGLQDRLRGLL